jgi:hypothetical protein
LRVRAGLILERVLLVFAAIILAGQAAALEAVSLPLDAKTLDLSGAVERFYNQSERIQVSTAPDANGIVRRIEVRSESPESASDWAVFALTNPSDEQIDRLLVVPHYRLVGSGLIWPDLGSMRLRTLTPSEGIAPERIPSSEADVFRITLDPGGIVTYVAELADPVLPEIHLWQPEAYEEIINSYTLYRGVVLGIAGLLALFLSVLSSSRAPRCSRPQPHWRGPCWPIFRSILASGAASSRALAAIRTLGAPARRSCSPGRC